MLRNLDIWNNIEDNVYYVKIVFRKPVKRFIYKAFFTYRSDPFLCHKDKMKLMITSNY